MSLKNLISSKSNLNQTQNIFVCRLGRAWFGELHILHSLVYIKNFSCYKIKKTQGNWDKNLLLHVSQNAQLIIVSMRGPIYLTRTLPLFHIRH